MSQLRKAARFNRVVGPAYMVVLLGATLAGQVNASAYKPPRALGGHPDLSGIWQAINTANWDIEVHTAKPPTVIALGALNAVPPGLGVVEGGPLPYRPDALKTKQENARNWVTLDPVIKCYMPGIP